MGDVELVLDDDPGSSDHLHLWEPWAGVFVSYGVDPILVEPDTVERCQICNRFRALPPGE